MAGNQVLNMPWASSTGSRHLDFLLLRMDVAVGTTLSESLAKLRELGDDSEVLWTETHAQQLAKLANQLKAVSDELAQTAGQVRQWLADTGTESVPEALLKGD